MKRALLSTLAALPMVLLAPAGVAQQFRYDIDAPGSIHLNEILEARVTLTSEGIPPGEEGVQGWQLGVAHENLEILSVTTAGTATETFFRKGFLFVGVTAGSGNDGFVSGVALSIDGTPATLPPLGSHVIARASYRVTSRACESGASIFVKDGLRGDGQPVENRVTWNPAGSFVPAFGRKDYLGCVPNHYRLSFNPVSKSLQARAGNQNLFQVEIVFEQQAPTASAWNLAVEHPAEDLTVFDASLVGSGVEELIETDGFALVELTGGAGNSGVVARVELSAASPRSLPLATHTLLFITYKVEAGTERVGEIYQTSLGFAQSLRGSSGFVSNRVDPEGVLALSRPLELTVEVLPAVRFVRGDASGDGELDIFDPVATLFFLFLGQGTLCRDAADASGDVSLDIRDPIYTLNYLFRGGPPPPSPWPRCGTFADGLGCELTSCP